MNSRICHVVASINAAVGGPAHSVSGLTAAMARAGAQIELMTLDYDRLGEKIPTPGVQLHAPRAGFGSRHLRGYHRAFRQELFEVAKHCGFIHNHGLWMFPNIYARQAAQKCGVPLITSTRGMLEDWSLARARAKKAVAWWSYERKNLQSAVLLHATSEAERDSLRRRGLRQPIAVIPNGVAIPEQHSQPGREEIERSAPELRGKRWLVFLSRLHPKKGLDRLLSVWGKLNTRFPDWQLVIAGPDSGKWGAHYRETARSEKLLNCTSFLGMVLGDTKTALLSNAGLFVLPSHSENFGIVIAEALGCGAPVITTRTTPWRALEDEQCGWWIENDEGMLAETLAAACQLSDQERIQMGARGRHYIERTFSWDGIAQKMLATYEWLKSGGATPPWVHL